MNAGRGAPVDVVGTVGGFTCKFVKFAVNTVTAWAAAPQCQRRDKNASEFQHVVSGLVW